jgi:hypothetical protein
MTELITDEEAWRRRGDVLQIKKQSKILIQMERPKEGI